MASSSASVPPSLCDQYSSGFSSDSPTSDLAAKWSTASNPSDSTPPASVIEACTNAAPGGTASACPVDRSSSTVTSCPSSRSCAATTLPMYPAPPVTSSFTVCSC